MHSVCRQALFVIFSPSSPLFNCGHRVDMDTHTYRDTHTQIERKSSLVSQCLSLLQAIHSCLHQQTNRYRFWSFIQLTTTRRSECRKVTLDTFKGLLLSLLPLFCVQIRPKLLLEGLYFTRWIKGTDCKRPLAKADWAIE